MPKFTVYIYEVHKNHVEIEAEDYLDAINRVNAGEGETKEDNLEYDYTMGPEDWLIEGPDDNGIPRSCEDFLGENEHEDDEG
jgi:hypothetical protein